MNLTNQPAISTTQHVGVVVCCLLFAAANVLVPITLGDVYPFTIAPMFRDAPQVYANYRVFAPDGSKLAIIRDAILIRREHLIRFYCVAITTASSRLRRGDLSTAYAG